MIIGYARVSTTEQNLDLQRDALKRAGCEKIIEDTVSGGRVQRPGLERVHDTLPSGDVLAVWRLDRLGRSLKHLIELMGELEAVTTCEPCRSSLYCCDRQNTTRVHRDVAGGKTRRRQARERW